MENITGASSGPGSREPDPAVPALRASIPRAWDAMTATACMFAWKNETLSVVSGVWLDKDRRVVTGPPETWVFLRYRFDDGKQITLRKKDMDSMHAAGVAPVWWSERHPAQGIETRSAKTEGLGPQDESPVTKSCAQGPAT